jgi:hypothetical protein
MLRVTIESISLNVIILNVVLLNVILLNVILLNVFLLNVFKLNVIIPIAIIQNVMVPLKRYSTRERGSLPIVEMLVAQKCLPSTKHASLLRFRIEGDL